MKLKLFIFPLCLIVLNAFGFEGTVKQTVKNYNGTGTNITMTWYLGPKNCRIDMAASGKDVNSNTVLIMDPATQMLKTYEANSAAGTQKLYFQVNASSITGEVNIINVNVTSETKQVNGYKCEKWVVITTTGTYNVWVTKDIAIDWAGYKNFFRNSVEVQALAQQGVKGFAMLVESNSGANASSVESVTPQAVAATVYTVPADYTLFVPQAAKPAKTK